MVPQEKRGNKEKGGKRGKPSVLKKNRGRGWLEGGRAPRGLPLRPTLLGEQMRIICIK